jgi:hypothetical protein
MSYIRRLVALPVGSGEFEQARRLMLRAFMRWIADAEPTPAETEEEITATVHAMRQLASLSERRLV